MKALLIKTPPLDVYEQMAFDEQGALGGGDGFSLRVYNWRGGGVTYGYAQFYDEVSRSLPPGTDATRRPFSTTPLVSHNRISRKIR